MVVACLPVVLRETERQPELGVGVHQIRAGRHDPHDLEPAAVNSQRAANDRAAPKVACHSSYDMSATGGGLTIPVSRSSNRRPRAAFTPSVRSRCASTVAVRMRNGRSPETRLASPVRKAPRSTNDRLNA